jgi:hypothetical protein
MGVEAAIFRKGGRKFSAKGFLLNETIFRSPWLAFFGGKGEFPKQLAGTFRAARLRC